MMALKPADFGEMAAVLCQPVGSGANRTRALSNQTRAFSDQTRAFPNQTRAFSNQTRARSLSN
jgi:hypothetical protein